MSTSFGWEGKGCMVHSISGRTWGVQVKLWDPLRTRAIPKHLRGVITTRHCTNPCLPLPYFTFVECTRSAHSWIWGACGGILRQFENTGLGTRSRLYWSRQKTKCFCSDTDNADWHTHTQIQYLLHPAIVRPMNALQLCRWQFSHKETL